MVKFTYKQFFILAVVACLVLLTATDAEAQCAMCKATAESSLKEGTGQAGNGINKGILYIMFVPYTLLMILIGVFFRKNVKSFLLSLGVFKA